MILEPEWSWRRLCLSHDKELKLIQPRSPIQVLCHFTRMPRFPWPNDIRLYPDLVPSFKRTGNGLYMCMID